MGPAVSTPARAPGWSTGGTAQAVSRVSSKTKVKTPGVVYTHPLLLRSRAGGWPSVLTAPTMGVFLFLSGRDGVGGEGFKMSHGDWLTAEARYIEETRAAFTTSLGGDLYFIKDIYPFMVKGGQFYIQNDEQQAAAFQLFNFFRKVIHVTKLKITSHFSFLTNNKV